jgi:hypothetical protein
MAAGAARASSLRASGGGVLTTSWTGGHQPVILATGGGRAAIFGARELEVLYFMLEPYTGPQPKDDSFMLEQ